MLLGPFEAKGWVSATPKGYGNWNATVASNQVYGATLNAGQTEPDLSFFTDDIWRGAGRESAPTSSLDGIAHDTLVRLDPSQAEALTFLDEVSAGTLHKAHEEWAPESTSDLNHSTYSYWRDLGETFGLSPSDAPGFDPVYAKWAYVWGIPSGIERAISLANGEEVETPVSTEGAYLVKVPFPDDFEVEGTYAAKGTSVPKDRSTLPPGEHARAKRTESPGEVFVRAEGTGLLRGIELTESAPMGPDGLEVTRTREIKIPDGVAEQRPEPMMSHLYR